MKLITGTQLGPYTILGPLGAGGMGEVYRARDTRLGRDVALKILTDKLEGHPDALERFDREARTVASLSHPNVVALYDYGKYDGTVCAITELLEGESLDRRLARERMSWRQAIEFAALIADGLSSAHARGIVHRDLKPGNVFITRDGQIKILDFGLATSAQVIADGRGGQSTVTVQTEPGTVLGTVGYILFQEHCPEAEVRPSSSRSVCFGSVSNAGGRGPGRITLDVAVKVAARRSFLHDRQHSV